MSAANGEKSSSILFLPPDVILLICSYCDLPALGKLSQVCVFFRDITARECLWVRRSQKALAANQLSEEIKHRSYQLLSAKDKCRVAYSWKHGIYKEDCLLRFRTRYMPWLELQSKYLWVSKGNVIECLPRTKGGNLIRRRSRMLKGHTQDVCRFRYNDGYLVSGGRDSRICVWSGEDGEPMVNRGQCHVGDVNCVDFRDSMVLSGSHDRSVKVWSFRENSLRHAATAQIQDRVWCVAINPNNSSFAVGSAGYFSVPPLHLYDLKSNSPISAVSHEFRNGAGILDICYESPFILLTCGYDTAIRMWDTRTGSCVAEWMDPHDSVVYCLSTDQNFTILSGTALHGLVRLWDKRCRNSIQMYYTGRGNSPAYSVTFDATSMYVALEDSVNILNFNSRQQQYCYNNNRLQW